jgi:hypothetical protein
MFTAHVARFQNIQRMTGRTDLGKSKEYKTVAAAIQHGAGPLIQNKDGHNFVVVLGPNGSIHHKTL